jgi:hypothetical protein
LGYTTLEDYRDPLYLWVISGLKRISGLIYEVTRGVLKI